MKHNETILQGAHILYQPEDVSDVGKVGTLHPVAGFDQEVFVFTRGSQR